MCDGVSVAVVERVRTMTPTELIDAMLVKYGLQTSDTSATPAKPGTGDRRGGGMADTVDSKSTVREDMRVRLSPSAPGDGDR